MSNWRDGTQESWSDRHNTGGSAKRTCRKGLLLSEDNRMQDEPCWFVDGGLQGKFWKLICFMDPR
jgi:hypothetical protein